MFPRSSQCKHWMFKDEQELNSLRRDANRKFVEKFSKNMPEDQRSKHFLSPAEERLLLRQYETQLREFCRRFSPLMPNSVSGTSFHYFKRFYLFNSMMDYHPKEILVTCVYLACKVEEFNVSIAQFVANIKGDREKASDIILNNELLLMQQLNYHLTIHNPYRPVEGLLIDIKTRCQSMKDPDQLRKGVDDFLEKTFFTDACLIYAPSQIALAAILHSASKMQQNLDAYVTDTLFGEHGKEQLPKLIEAVRKVRSMVKAVEIPQRETMKQVERRLERCRNQENNPDSQAYKRKMQEMMEEEEDRQVKKYVQDVEEQRKAEDKLLKDGRSSSPNV